MLGFTAAPPHCPETPRNVAGKSGSAKLNESLLKIKSRKRLHELSVFFVLTRLTPIGVCFMVAGSVLGRENIESDFIQLGLFVVTVIAGLLIYLILTLLVLFAASGKNPFRLLKYSLEPFLICFATTSTYVFGIYPLCLLA